MIRVSVHADVKAISAQLDQVARKQIPFATAQALTAVAKAAQAKVTRDLPTIFDRPTPFTLRAVGVTSATKASQTAVVFIKPVQAAYLGIEETGGTRLPSRTALVLPGSIRLNAYGNIPKGALARAKARRNVFVGQVHGVGGFWQRGKGGLKLLVAFKARATYKPRFGFAANVTAVVRSEIAGAMRDALARALATARP